jgi:chemotaxis protein CheD
MKQDNSYFLLPSKLFVTSKPYDIITVLGSCVAVCLYDKHNKVAGMNHYMLPLWNGKELATPKYGNIATQKLIRKMIDFGAERKNLTAKIFGGAEVIHARHQMFQIGKKNVSIAHKILDEEGIPIIRSSTGMREGRKILFRTTTGEVFMKFVRRQNIEERVA